MLELSEATKLLKQGELVAMPTETVYGVAADACNCKAVEKIYALKSRMKHNPLIVHVADVARARVLGLFNHEALKLAHHFWPGPLTLVVPLMRPSPLCDAVTAGLDSVGLRVPRHASAQALLQAFDHGLAAPSANLSGRLSASLAEHVFCAFGNRLPIMAGEAPQVGLESCIVGVDDEHLSVLREGAITQTAIERLLGRPIQNIARNVGIGVKNGPQKPQAPGMLLKHYAPRAPLLFNATDWEEGDALLGFGPPPGAVPKHYLNLSVQGNVTEAAHNLYAMLHALDKKNPARILVQPVPDQGIGAAINDRLSRANAAHKS